MRDLAIDQPAGLIYCPFRALLHLPTYDELDAARRAHAEYFLALAEQADPLLRRHGQSAWYVRLESERDNLRAALRWLLDTDEFEKALHMAVALGHFWWRRGYHAEGWRWLEEALRKAPDGNSAVRTKGLLHAGLLLVT
jgi:predicted ATPase